MEIGTSMTVQNANSHIFPYLGVDFRKQDHIKEARVILKAEQKVRKALPRQGARGIQIRISVRPKFSPRRDNLL
jgi:hypothetical protein